MLKLIACRQGQSLVEILVAVAIGALMITAAAGIIAPVLRVNTQTSKAQAATALAKELQENVRVWSESDWHRIYSLATTSANHYYLITTSSPFASSTGDESVVVATTTYKRFFYTDIVNRDSSGNIVPTSTGSLDPSTLKLTIGYSWPPQGTTTTLSTYLTRYVNRALIQTDWSLGPGQAGPVTSTNGFFATSSKIDYTTTTGSIYIKF
jgi:type II secretory pathway pseudopilin PulG